MKRISRLAAAVICSVLLFSFTTAAVAGDDSTSVSDLKEYVTQILK